MTRRSFVGLVAVALLAAGCLPNPATSEARAVTALYTVFLVAAAFVAVVVWGLMSWSLVRYRGRHRAQDGVLPPQTRGSVGLEIVWTAIPALLALGLFVVTFGVINQVDARVPQPPVRVEVEAFRWGWRFVYPAERVTVVGLTGQTPEVVLPVGQTVSIGLRSADVIHAFYVPQFLFKRDAIPGRTNDFDLTIEQPGYYGGQCAEFCGTFHARMPFAIRAVPEAEYRAWLQAQEGAGS